MIQNFKQKEKSSSEIFCEGVDPRGSLQRSNSLFFQNFLTSASVCLTKRKTRNLLSFFATLSSSTLPDSVRLKFQDISEAKWRPWTVHGPQPRLRNLALHLLLLSRTPIRFPKSGSWSGFAPFFLTKSLPTRRTRRRLSLFFDRNASPPTKSLSISKIKKPGLVVFLWVFLF